MKPAKSMLSVFIAAVLAVTSLFLSVDMLKVSAASVLKITGTDIWVRTTPGIGDDTTKIEKTNTPDSYEIKGTTEKDGYTWYNITYNGQDAWVPIKDSTWGVVATQPETTSGSVLQITGNTIKVRNLPGISNTFLGHTNFPDAYTILSEPVTADGYTWYNVTYNSQNAWIPFDSSWAVVISGSGTDTEFEQKIAEFPESYKEKLRILHLAYPNWEFKADKINRSFNQVVAEQEPGLRKQTQYPYYNYSRLSMAAGNYDWQTGTYIESNGGWYGASKEWIAYNMDPRNSLDAEKIFSFSKQVYNSSVQNRAGIEKIVQGTFLANGYNGGNYIDDIMEAANQSGVCPYAIAAKILQEQGTNGTSSLISGTYSGYENYYNFFNVQATGSTSTAVIVNGLSHAKSMGWNTRRASIIGGAKFYAENYTNAGQYNFYLMNFNVKNPDKLWHQYAQNVEDTIGKAAKLAKAYISNSNSAAVFYIPVYNDMPESAVSLPVNNAGKNNYYITSMSVSGLTPSFGMFTYEYDLQISGATNIVVSVPSGASLVSASSYSIKAGNNTVVITVKAESGYTNNYTIYVNSTVATTLTINGSATSVKKGDTNSDGKIDIIDLARVQMHILGIKTMNDSTATNAADTNSDGKIDIIDLAKIQMHILGVKSLN